MSEHTSLRNLESAFTTPWTRGAAVQGVRYKFWRGKKATAIITDMPTAFMDINVLTARLYHGLSELNTFGSTYVGIGQLLQQDNARSLDLDMYVNERRHLFAALLDFSDQQRSEVDTIRRLGEAVNRLTVEVKVLKDDAKKCTLEHEQALNEVRRQHSQELVVVNQKHTQVLKSITHDLTKALKDITQEHEQSMEGMVRRHEQRHIDSDNTIHRYKQLNKRQEQECNDKLHKLRAELDLAVNARAELETDFEGSHQNMRR